MDIHYESFKQWLIDRRMLPKDHISQLMSIRHKVQLAWSETAAMSKSKTSKMGDGDVKQCSFEDSLLDQKIVELQKRARADPSAVIARRISGNDDDHKKNHRTENENLDFTKSDDHDDRDDGNDDGAFALVNYPMAQHLLHLLQLAEKRQMQQQKEQLEKEKTVDKEASTPTPPPPPQNDQHWMSDIMNFVRSNLLGGLRRETTAYTRRIDAWRVVVDAYEHNNLYMAELASQMIQNVKYEIPALRKTLSKCQKSIDEWNRKEREWTKNVALYERKLAQECEQLGIENPQSYHDVIMETSNGSRGIESDDYMGQYLETEVYNMAMRELPSFYGQVQHCSHDDNLWLALDFYCAFISFLSGRDMANDSKFMSMLKFLKRMTNSNSDDIVVDDDDNGGGSVKYNVYDYRRCANESDATLNYDPIEFERYSKERAQKRTLSTQSTNNDNIGANNTSDTSGTSVTDPLSIQKSDEEVPLQIDWSAIETDDAIDNSDSGNVAEIVWDVTADGSDEIEIESGKVIELGEESLDHLLGQNDKTAAPHDHEQQQHQQQHLEQIWQMKNESVFSNDETRNIFMDNMVELESFVDCRIQDKIDAENALNSVDSEIFKSAPKVLQTMSMDQLKRFQKSVKHVVGLLGNDRLKQLLLIKTSKRYRERLARSLRQRIEAIGQLQHNLKSVEEKRREQVSIMEATQPEMDRLVRETIEIQDFLQSRLSEMVKRPVHIFGEINTLRQ